MLGMNLKHLNQKFLDLLDKEQRINQKYDKNPAQKGKKHRLHDDIINDFIDDIDNYGFDRYHFRDPEYQTNQPVDLNNKQHSESKSVKVRKRPQTSMVYKQNQNRLSSAKQVVEIKRDINSAKTELFRKKNDQLQVTKDNYLSANLLNNSEFKLNVQRNNTMQHNLQKAQKKYWKTTKNVYEIEEKKVFRNHSATQKLKYQTESNFNILKKIDELDNCLEQLDGNEDNILFVQKLNQELIGQRFNNGVIVPSDQKISKPSNQMNIFISKQEKQKQMNSFKESVGYLKNIKIEEEAHKEKAKQQKMNDQQSTIKKEQPIKKKNDKQNVKSNNYFEEKNEEMKKSESYEYKMQRDYLLLNNYIEVHQFLKKIDIIQTQLQFHQQQQQQQQQITNNQNSVADHLLDQIEWNQVNLKIAENSINVFILNLSKFNMIFINNVFIKNNCLLKNGNPLIFRHLFDILRNDKNIYSDKQDQELFYVLIFEDLNDKTNIVLQKLISIKEMKLKSQQELINSGHQSIRNSYQQILNTFLRLLLIYDDFNSSMNQIFQNSLMILKGQKKVHSSVISLVQGLKDIQIQMEDQNQQISLNIYQFFWEMFQTSDGILNQYQNEQRNKKVVRPKTAKLKTKQNNYESATNQSSNTNNNMKQQQQMGISYKQYQQQMVPANISKTVQNSLKNQQKSEDIVELIIPQLGQQQQYNQYCKKSCNNQSYRSKNSLFRGNSGAFDSKSQLSPFTQQLSSIMITGRPMSRDLQQ